MTLSELRSQVNNDDVFTDLIEVIEEEATRYEVTVDYYVEEFML
jgi:hypothetical protein|tara:strand:- start:107 stop:238 length:132 start_codon:yes stop_codon:yes gene_type:complete